MTAAQHALQVETRGRGFLDVTGRVTEVVARSGIRQGMCVVFCQHTSCGLLIQENADPDVRADFEEWLAGIAPDGDARYRHDAEGQDDMAAHLRCALTRTSESIPVAEGRLALGRWQGLYLVEHRTGPHSRRLIVHVAGE